MRSSQVVTATDSLRLSRICPGYVPRILQISEIWGEADEAVKNKVQKKSHNPENTKKKVFLVNPAVSVSHSFTKSCFAAFASHEGFLGRNVINGIENFI